MLKQMVLGMLLIWAGFVLVYYSSNLVDLIGRNDRAEKNIWWTRNAIILFSFVVMVLWVLFMFGMLNVWSPTDIATTNIIN